MSSCFIRILNVVEFRELLGPWVVDVVVIPMAVEILRARF